MYVTEVLGLCAGIKQLFLIVPQEMKSQRNSQTKLVSLLHSLHV